MHFYFIVQLMKYFVHRQLRKLRIVLRPVKLVLNFYLVMMFV